MKLKIRQNKETALCVRKKKRNKNYSGGQIKKLGPVIQEHNSLVVKRLICTFALIIFCLRRSSISPSNILCFAVRHLAVAGALPLLPSLQYETRNASLRPQIKPCLLICRSKMNLSLISRFSVPFKSAVWSESECLLLNLSW